MNKIQKLDNYLTALEERVFLQEELNKIRKIQLTEDLTVNRAIELERQSIEYERFILMNKQELNRLQDQFKAENSQND